MALELDRVKDLPKFPAERAGVEMEPQSGQLHRDGRSARARMAGADKVPGCAQERHRIYSKMLRKIFVLESDGGVDERGRNLAERSPDAIFQVLGQRDAKDVAVAIAHPRREIDPVEQR